MCNDVLRNAAIVFCSLLRYKYHIVLGRKEKAEQIDIRFLPEVFFHLAGFHYLEKHYFFSSFNATKILSSILEGKITLSHIQNDSSWGRISSRLTILENLECILDDCESEFFKYEKKKTKNNSKIKASYLAKSTLPNSDISFVFFLKESNTNFYITNSVFTMENYDYSLGQVKYTLLLKEKINLKENTSQILFHHKKYSLK